MKRYFNWLICVVMTSCVSSCTYTDGVTWSLCVHSDDTLEIVCPVTDNLFNLYYYNNNILNMDREKHSITILGDAYVCGDYFYTNKDHKYRYTERRFTINRLSKKEPIKAFVLYHNTPASSFGWIPADISKRDSVFDVMTQYYGEENLIQLPVNEEQISFSFQP